MKAVVAARISAATIAHQTPFILKKIGKIIIAAVWKTKILRKEITAEIAPLLRAVKKAEPKIPNPFNRKERA